MTYASHTRHTGLGTRILIAFFCASVLMFSLPTISHAADTTTPAATATATTGTAQQPQPIDNSCSYNPATWFYGCFWLSIVSAISSLFLSIGILFLELAGLVFNTLVSWVIINFAGTLGTGGLNILDAIQKAWTVFRDFSNILIIGMFVFIAICIILGIKEYGQKKLIANVLIIAVLINFSLLFTKIIIDFSNFTAYQIYQQMATKDKNGNFDLTSSFLTPMKITSVFDSYKAVRDAGNNTSYGATAIFAYGLLGGLMLFAVAVVLLYGCFLIASRAILFIILMLASPIAFASFLIPNFSKGEYGWSGWWKSLLNSAIFAPLVMLFLAASLAIIKTASIAVPGGTATLGGIIQDPASQSTGDVWKVMFIYILGTGLLFISFRLSSHFAGSISGMQWTPAAFERVLFAPAQGYSALRRATSGRAAANRALTLEHQADETAKRIAEERAVARKNNQPFDEFKANRPLVNILAKKAKQEEKAKSSFDVAGKKPVQALSKSLGLPGAIKEDKTNYADNAKARAEHAAKEAVEAAVSRDDAEKMARGKLDRERQAERDALIDGQRRNNAALIQATRESAEKKQGENIDQRLATAQAGVEAARAAAGQLGQQLAPQRQQAVEHAQQEEREVVIKKQEINDGADVQLQPILAELRGGGASEQQQQNLRSQRDAIERERKTALDEQDLRIKQARQITDNIDQRIREPIANAEKELNAVRQRVRDIDAPVTALTNAANELEGKIKTFDKETDRLVKSEGDKIVQASVDNAQHVAGQLTKGGFTRTLERIMPITTSDQFVVEQSRNLAKKKIKTKPLKDRVAAEREALRDAGEGDAGAAPAAPAADH